MNIREIGKPTTAKALNETLAKRFGKKVDLESFTMTQLEDARNKLRTTLSQVETNEKFESVHSSDEYQRSKLFLDVLNAEISERESMPDFIEEKHAKPDFVDVDNDGNTKEPISKAAKDKEKEGKTKKKKPKDLSKVPPQLRKHMAKTNEGKNPTKAHVMKMIKDGKSDKEMMNMHSDADKDKLKAMIKDCKKEIKESKDQGKVIIENYFKSLIEGKEDEAEIVMAAKDMVDRVTNWMEDTAEMQAESMLELGDAIRDEMGQEKSDAFIASVKPAFESLYSSLESTRGTLTGGVAQLTGEGAPAQDMGAEGGEEPIPAETDADMEPTVDQEDDFSASEPAAGGEEEAGRDKRESKIMKHNMLETSRRLGTILSKKK